MSRDKNEKKALKITMKGNERESTSNSTGKRGGGEEKNFKGKNVTFQSIILKGNCYFYKSKEEMDNILFFLIFNDNFISKT